MHNESSEVSIITRSPTVSFSLKGQVTKHTAAKRSIAVPYFSIIIINRYGNDLTQGERRTLTRVSHYQFYLSIVSAMQPTIHTAYIISLLHGKGLKFFKFQHSIPAH